MIRFVLVFGMQTYQEHVHYFHIIFAFQNRLIRIQLQAVVPVIRVGYVFNDRVLRTLAVCFFYFATSFPVVNTKCAVFFVSKHHINRTRKSQLFMEYRPLCSIGFEVWIVFEELFKVFVFDTGILARTLVVVALDIVVHRGPRGGGFIAVLIPSCLNFVRGLSILLTFSPLFGSHHGVNNGIGVELFKV